MRTVSLGKYKESKLRKANLVFEDLVVRGKLHSRKGVGVLAAFGEEIVPASAEQAKIWSAFTDQGRGALEGSV